VLTSRVPTFRWQAVSGARRYFIQIYNQNAFSAVPDGLRYTSPRLRERTFELPHSDQLPNGTYYWNVTAVGENGQLSPVSETRRFTIHEPSVLTAPVTVDDSYMVVSNQMVAAPGFLSNDTLNGGIISAVNGSTALSGVPTVHGSVTIAPDGSFVYTAVEGYVGSDTFTYVLTSEAGSSTATVILDVCADATLPCPAVTDDQGPEATAEPVVEEEQPVVEATALPDITEPTNPDSDGDGLLDAWELASFGDLNQSADADSDVDSCNHLCEFENELDPNNPDWDGDGLLDGHELAIGSQPKNMDTDSDGLVDSDEVNGSWGYVTNPTSVDTDADGLFDRMEYEENTDPTTVDTDIDGLKDGEEINGIGVQGVTSNPHQNDTDSDGVTDYTEILHGTTNLPG
jgi:hypothetical protein